MKMTLKKVIFFLLLLIINTIAVTMIGVSFLGASNANGEGAPRRNETELFLSLFLYIIIVSIVFSSLTYLLAAFFRPSLDFIRWKNRKVLLVQFAFLISVFLL